jgi:hypothetical protein
MGGGIMSVMSNDNVRLALKEAVQSLYFDDDSDYGTALWKIVEFLGGEEAAKLLEEDEEMAYAKYVEGV